MREKRKGYFIVVILIFILALFYAWEQIESERMLYRLQKLDTYKQQKLDEHSELYISYSELKSYKRLDEIAKKMGFSVPHKDKIIHLSIY